MFKHFWRAARVCRSQNQAYVPVPFLSKIDLLVPKKHGSIQHCSAKLKPTRRKLADPCNTGEILSASDPDARDSRSKLDGVCLALYVAAEPVRSALPVRTRQGQLPAHPSIICHCAISTVRIVDSGILGKSLSSAAGSNTNRVPLVMCSPNRKNGIIRTIWKGSAA